MPHALCSTPFAPRSLLDTYGVAGALGNGTHWLGSSVERRKVFSEMVDFWGSLFELLKEKLVFWKWTKYGNRFRYSVAHICPLPHALC